MVRATGWHSGVPAMDPAGYGLRFSEQDRNRHFDKGWSEVIVEMEGETSTTVPLSPSFWRSCPELRSAEIGQWLLDAQAAPWTKGSPPGIAVTPVADNRFAVRVLRKHTLPGR